MVKKMFSLDNRGLNYLRPRQNIISAVFFGFVLLLGTSLRIYNLGTESYWVDEMYTVIESRQSIYQTLTSGRLDQPPAYYIPFHLWVQTFGDTEISTRLFSVIVGIGSIILIYLIGQKLFGRSIGIISAFFMAISGFQILYSQEARFYTFFQFTTLLSFLFFIQAFESKRVVYFAIYCLSSILMLYSHTYGVFILAAQNFIFLTKTKDYRKFVATWFICQIVIGIAFLPYFYNLAFGGSGGVGGTVLSNSTGTFIPSIMDPFRFIYRFIFPVRGAQSWTAILPRFILAGALLIVGVCTSFIQLKKSEFVNEARNIAASLQKEDFKNKLILLGSWLLCPIVLPFVLSFILAPMLTDRYAICAAPALYLILALIIFNVRKVIPILISLGAFAIIIVPGLHYYYNTNMHQQWREAAAFVKENADQQGKIIVFAGGMGTGIEQKSFNWYYRDTLPSCNLSNDLADPTMKSDALTKCVAGYNRFWVVIRSSTEPSNPANTYKHFFTGSKQNTMQLLESAQFVDISVYLFELEQ